MHIFVYVQGDWLLLAGAIENLSAGFEAYFTHEAAMHDMHIYTTSPYQV